ncbi:MAG: alginate export family protein [Akkermansiaceae bacterium]
MKTNTLLATSLTVLSVAPLAQAGSDPVIPAQPSPEEAAKQFFKLNGNIRTRYEFREQDGADASHALTARARVGITLGDFNGFSAFVEGEATYALIDDYKSNPTGSKSTEPFVLGNTVIGDPNNAELNRAWLQYEKSGFAFKLGRQRIIRDSAAFIGNVGWRQNEQTFDAAQISYEKDDFKISYVYSDRALRIFGADANDALPGPPLRAFEGDFHFLDASYKTGSGNFGGYVYLIDVENNANVGKSNTYGAFFKNDSFHVEFAGQNGTSNLAAGDYDAVYGHVVYTKKHKDSAFSFGVEYLGEDFKTPFGTVHAYNGYADAFILNRIGLSDSGGNYEGITDFYVGYTQKGLPYGLVLKMTAHYFMDDSMDQAYGSEIDAVLIKAFRPDLKGVIKAAYFNADKGSGYSDIQQISMGMNYSF